MIELYLLDEISTAVGRAELVLASHVKRGPSGDVDDHDVKTLVI